MRALAISALIGDRNTWQIARAEDFVLCVIGQRYVKGQQKNTRILDLN